MHSHMWPSCLSVQPDSPSSVNRCNSEQILSWSSSCVGLSETKEEGSPFSLSFSFSIAKLVFSNRFFSWPSLTGFVLLLFYFKVNLLKFKHLHQHRQHQRSTGMTTNLKITTYCIMDRFILTDAVSRWHCSINEDNAFLRGASACSPLQDYSLNKS